jgi:hypothetical protein
MYRTATVKFLAGIVLVVATSGVSQTSGGSPLGIHDKEFVVKLMSPISTKTSQRGDSFTAQVVSPAEYQGAVMEGKITDVKKAKKGNAKAAILFQFQTLTVGDKTAPITADLKQVANSKGVKEVDEEGRAIGKSSNKKKAGSALAGAAVGSLIGGLAGGAKGAAVGAGAGAAAGLLFAVTLTASGTDMEFAPGSEFTLAVSDRGRN